MAVDRRRGESIARDVCDVPFPETPPGRNERFARALVAPFVAGPSGEDEGARCQLLFLETRARRLSRDVGACETRRDVAPRDHASCGLARDIRTRSGSVAYLPERLDPTLRVADWADRRDSREKDPGAQSATDAARNDVWSSLATDETACFDALNARARVCRPNELRVAWFRPTRARESHGSRSQRRGSQ